MEIKKPGNSITYDLTCPRCACEFTANFKDGKVHKVIDLEDKHGWFNLYIRHKTTETFMVLCPCCNTLIEKVIDVKYEPWKTL